MPPHATRRTFLAGTAATGLAAAGGLLARQVLGADPVLATPLAPRARSGDDDRPNIVVVILDDTHPWLWEEMGWLRSRADATGWVRFHRAVLDTPICAPSRASLLSGESTRRHGMSTNDVADVQAFHDAREQELLGPVLKDAGYATGYLGKYLNGYPWAYGQVPSSPDGRDQRYRPPGWDRWWVVTDQVGAVSSEDQGALYRHYVVNDDGTIRHHGSRDSWGRAAQVGATPEARRQRAGSTDYLTDRLNLEARAALDGLLPEPFALFVGHIAPHAAKDVAGPFGVADVARRHREVALRGPSIHEAPAFGEPDLSDKPRWLQATAPSVEDFAASWRDELDRTYLELARAVQSVDEFLYDLDRALAETTLEDRTVVMVYSDNGICLGEHRVTAKVRPWEPSISTDLWVRHPAVGTSWTSPELVSHLDVPATILSLTAAQPRRPVDGRDLVPLLTGPPAPDAQGVLRTDVAVSMTNPAAGACPAYHLVRAADGWKYVRYEAWTKKGASFPAEEELYQLVDDPGEERNLVTSDDPEAVAALARLRRRLDELVAAGGPT